MEKIIFLGTAGDAIVTGKQLHSSGGIVVQVDDNQFHLDPGPGSLVRAGEYNVSIRNNTAVIATHSQVRVGSDINAVISAMTHSGMDKHGVAIACRSIVDGNDTTSRILSTFHKSCVEKVVALDPGQRVGINNVEIKATYAKHSDQSAIGIRLITPYFNLGYTSETEYSSKLIDEFKGVDVLVVCVQFPQDAKVLDCMNSQEALKLIKEVKPKLAIITGYGVKMLQNDPINEARMIQKATGVQTIAAKDGMVINPVSYSVNLRQKTLRMF